MGQAQTQETLQGPASIGPLWRIFQLLAMLTAVSWLISYAFYLNGYTALVQIFGIDSVFWFVGGVAYFLSPIISFVLIGMAVKPETFRFLNRGDAKARIARALLLLIPLCWLGTVFVGAPSMINPMLKDPLSHSTALPVTGGAFFHAVFQHWFQGFAAMVLALAPSRFARITESDRPAGTGAVVREATRQAELDRRLKALHQATREMKAARTPERVARIAADAAEDVLGLQSSRVHLHEDDAATDGEELVPAAWTDGAEDALGGPPSTIDGSAGLVWDTFQTGDATYYPDHRGESGGSDADEPSLQSSFLLPLGDRGILIAQSTEPTELTDPEIELGHVLSATTEAALAKTEDERELELFRALVDRTSESAFVIDPDSGAVLDVNDAACRGLGYTDEELRKMPFANVVASIDAVLSDGALGDGGAVGEDGAPGEKRGLGEDGVLLGDDGMFVPDGSTADDRFGAGGGIDEADGPTLEAVLEAARTRGKVNVEAHHRRKDDTTVPVELTVHHVELDREYLLAIASDRSEGADERPSLVREIRAQGPATGEGIGESESEGAGESVAEGVGEPMGVGEGEEAVEGDRDGVVLPEKGDCLLILRRHRWPEEVVCPHCDGRDTIKKGTTGKGAKRYWCHECEQTFNDLTGTIFAEHRLTLPEMYYIIREMDHQKTAEIARQIDRSYQSVLEFVHEVQRASEGDVEFVR